MKIRNLILVTLLLSLQTANCQSPPRTPLSVTYVANEGFLLECPGKKVAIDALFGGWQSDDYYMPSDTLVEQMKNARPPFDRIDVIAVTHYHTDHFDPGIVASYLGHNPDAVLICAPQAAEKLAASDGYADFKNRIRVISAPDDSLVTFDIRGIGITAIPGRHGSYSDTDSLTGEYVDRHRNVQHLEFLISMNGRKVYHSGDAPLNDMRRYSRLGFGQRRIDLAMVQWFSPGELISFREKLVREVIGADTLILMHLWPRRNPFGPEQRKLFAARNIFIPQRPLEQWTIP